MFCKPSCFFPPVLSSITDPNFCVIGNRIFSQFLCSGKAETKKLPSVSSAALAHPGGSAVGEEVKSQLCCPGFVTKRSPFDLGQLSGAVLLGRRLFVWSYFEGQNWFKLYSFLRGTF